MSVAVELLQPMCATCFTSVGQPICISGSFAAAGKKVTRATMENDQRMVQRNKELFRACTALNCLYSLFLFCTIKFRNSHTTLDALTEDLREDLESLEDPFHLVGGRHCFLRRQAGLWKHEICSRKEKLPYRQRRRAVTEMYQPEDTVKYSGVR